MTDRAQVYEQALINIVGESTDASFPFVTIDNIRGIAQRALRIAHTTASEEASEARDSHADRVLTPSDAVASSGAPTDYPHDGPLASRRVGA